MTCSGVENFLQLLYWSKSQYSIFSFTYQRKPCHFSFCASIQWLLPAPHPMCTFSTQSNLWLDDNNRVMFILCTEGDHSEADVPQTAHQPIPGDGKIPAGAHCPCPYWLRSHQVRKRILFTLLFLIPIRVNINYIWQELNRIPLSQCFGEYIKLQWSLCNCVNRLFSFTETPSGGKFCLHALDEELV